MKKKDAFMRAACVVLIVLFGAGFLVSCKRSDIQADEDDILINCPFDLSDGFDWNFYPPENVLGFTAFGREDLDGMRTDIFVFDLRTTECGSIFTGAESIETYAKRGWFEADEKETSTNGDYYFVKLRYDSRIELYILTINFGYESLLVDFKDGLYVLYHNLINSTCFNKDQSFDEALGRWSEVTENEEEIPAHSEGIEPVVYDKLDVWEEASTVIIDDMTLSVKGYIWEKESYNIYDEIVFPAHMSISCLLNAGNGKTFEEYGDAVPDLDPSQMKFFVRTDNGYKEITPDDFTVNISVDYDEFKCFEVSSESIGELQEGDYRLEIDGYTIDFRLSIAEVAVW